MMNGSGPTPTIAGIVFLFFCANGISHAQTAAEAAVDSATILNDATGVSTQRCRDLWVVAYESLGFSSPAAIRAGDFLFCGTHYLAWIDNTGFYGEMQALFAMNGQENNALNFILSSDGLPRNMLIAGERRDGQWAPGYSGSQHLEVVNYIREPGDPTEQNCSCPPVGRYCNGFGLNEAGSFSDPDIPWWNSCNPGSPSFTQYFPPFQNDPIDMGGGGKKRLLMWEARLTKESDNDTNPYNGDNCHADWLFPDGIRRPLYLQVGWELWGRQTVFYKRLRIRNPAGNPVPVQPQCDVAVVHASVMTDLVAPPPGKNFREWVLPQHTVTSNSCPPLPAAGNKTFVAGQYGHNGSYPLCPSPNDILLGGSTVWLLSSVNPHAKGKTIMYGMDFPNFDNQPCECITHGGFELAGGAVRDLQTLPGGSITQEHRIYYNLPGGTSCP